MSHRTNILLVDREGKQGLAGWLTLTGPADGDDLRASQGMRDPHVGHAIQGLLPPEGIRTGGRGSFQQSQALAWKVVRRLGLCPDEMELRWTLALREQTSSSWTVQGGSAGGAFALAAAKLLAGHPANGTAGGELAPLSLPKTPSGQSQA